MKETLLPLFPLEVVLLPESPLPLHIFEERYKTMINECVKEQREFGVVLAQGGSLERIGCTAKVINIIRKYDDGRMDILTSGRRRFEILHTHEDRPYLQARVYWFDDEEGKDLAPLPEARRAIDLFTQVWQRVRKAEDIPVHFPTPYRHLSFRIAASLPLDLKFKQQTLALRSEPERLLRVTRLLETLLPQLNRTEKVRTKSKSNGHAPL